MFEKEYIDLEEAVATLKRNSLKCFNSYYKGYVNAIEDLADIPTADVSPVRHGRWIEECEESLYSCSACGAEWVTIEGTPKENDMDFCPHCGAKMDLKEV